MCFTVSKAEAKELTAFSDDGFPDMLSELKTLSGKAVKPCIDVNDTLVLKWFWKLILKIPQSLKGI